MKLQLLLFASIELMIIVEYVGVAHGSVRFLRGPQVRLLMIPNECFVGTLRE